MKEILNMFLLYFHQFSVSHYSGGTWVIDTLVKNLSFEMVRMAQEVNMKIDPKKL